MQQVTPSCHPDNPTRRFLARVSNDRRQREHFAKLGQAARPRLRQGGRQGITLKVIALPPASQRAFAETSHRLSRHLALAGFDAELGASGDGRALQGRGAAHAEAATALGLRCRFIGGEPPAEPSDGWSQFQKNWQALVPKAGEGSRAGGGSVTYEAVLRGAGEGAVLDALSRAELFFLAGWGRMATLTDWLESLLEKAFENFGDQQARTFVFDLNDNRQRPAHELFTALRLISRYQERGDVVLCLGAAEAIRAAQALKLTSWRSAEPGAAASGAQQLRQHLRLTAVAIEGLSGVALATREGTAHRLSPVAAVPPASRAETDPTAASSATPVGSDTPLEAAEAARDAAFNVALGWGIFCQWKLETTLDLATFARRWTLEKDCFPTRDDFLR